METAVREKIGATVFASITLVIFVAVILSGCGSGQAQAEPVPERQVSAPAEPEAPREHRYLHLVFPANGTTDLSTEKLVEYFDDHPEFDLVSAFVDSERQVVHAIAQKNRHPIDGGATNP